MKESKEEKRSRLLAKAGSIIDAYLEWEEAHPRPDLMEIEEVALRLRKEIGQEIAQVAIENQASQTPVPGPKCARCGKEMRYKGKKRSQVESRAGSLQIERGYYYCPECKASIFPPGQAVTIERQELERGGSAKSREIQCQNELRRSDGSAAGVGPDRDI